MDATGTFAEAVGRENFQPYFHDTMKQGFQGIELGSARLRECSFLFFGVMARVFQDDFAQYLPKVVPPLLASCRQSEHGEEDVSGRLLPCNKDYFGLCTNISLFSFRL